MRYLLILFALICFIGTSIGAVDTDFLSDFLLDIRDALNAEGITDENEMRQHQNLYRQQKNRMSLEFYDALRSIAKNDELECIPRLLCEAAAGGQPGYGGKQIKFDKLFLTKLISYLNLDTSKSSPLLVFGKAALLGVSNRGDSYSCIVNYPKCPKDQSRLLYYLNNHRGGFFQYFDKKHLKPESYYGPGYYYQKYQRKNSRNQISFQNLNKLSEKSKGNANSEVYAKKYSHSFLTFLRNGYEKDKRPMAFPTEESYSKGFDPRILVKPVIWSSDDKSFVFSNSNRSPKKYIYSRFFPGKDQSQRKPATFGTDRLPKKFYFPEIEKLPSKQPIFPTRYSANSFFPVK